MKSQQNLIISVAVLVIGIFVGWLIWGNRVVAPGMHRMSDGSMMSNTTIHGDMDDMMVGMMSGLEGKTGDEFDEAFLKEMIVHHEGAVKMAELVLETSKRPELIQLANEIITAQTKEIQMMKDWGTAWFK